MDEENKIKDIEIDRSVEDSEVTIGLAEDFFMEKKYTRTSLYKVHGKD